MFLRNNDAEYEVTSNMFRLAYGGVKIGASNVAHPTLVNMMEMNGARMGHLHWSRGKTAFGTFNT